MLVSLKPVASPVTAEMSTQNYMRSSVIPLVDRPSPSKQMLPRMQSISRKPLQQPASSGAPSPTAILPSASASRRSVSSNSSNMVIPSQMASRASSYANPTELEYGMYSGLPYATSNGFPHSQERISPMPTNMPIQGGMHSPDSAGMSHSSHSHRSSTASIPNYPGAQSINDIATCRLCNHCRSGRLLMSSIP